MTAKFFNEWEQLTRHLKSGNSAIWLDCKSVFQTSAIWMCLSRYFKNLRQQSKLTKEELLITPPPQIVYLLLKGSIYSAFIKWFYSLCTTSLDNTGVIWNESSNNFWIIMAVKHVISHSIAVSSQGFLRWGASMPAFGVKTYHLARSTPKITLKWKKLDRGRVLLEPPWIRQCIVKSVVCLTCVGTGILYFCRCILESPFHVQGQLS